MNLIPSTAQRRRWFEIVISSRGALKTYLFSIIWHEAKPRTSPLFTEVHFLVHEVSFGRTSCSTFEVGRDFFALGRDLFYEEPFFTEVHFLGHEVSFGRTSCSNFEVGRDFFALGRDLFYEEP